MSSGGKMKKQLPKIGNGPRQFEIPFAYYNIKPGSILDIGQSNGRLQKELIKDKHALTVIDPNKDTVKKAGITYHINDIRKLDSKQIGTFDNILLISTIEHVGLPCYGQEKSWEDSPFEEQFRCLKHCSEFLKPKGRIILTMPIGSPQENPSFKLLYNLDMMERIKKEFNVIKEEYITFDPVAKKRSSSVWWKAKLKDCSFYGIAKPGTQWGVAMFLIEAD